MGLVQRIIDGVRGRKPSAADDVRAKARKLLARYDASQTTPENRRHWANADSLSAEAANSPSVRHILRSRARYEFDNNGYIRNIVEGAANDEIGTGPRLRITGIPRDDRNQVIAKFHEWAERIDLASKLWLGRLEKAKVGEVGLMLRTNPAVEGQIKLDVMPFECDRMATPNLLNLYDPAKTDGINFDAYGNPVSYNILRYHPGGPLATSFEFDVVPARFIIHWFTALRPEQRRGIPEILTSLPIAAYMRRWSLATLSAAELAALLTAVLETDGDPDTEDVPSPFESLELDRGTLNTLPAGSKLKQLEPTQPTAEYSKFKREIIAEMGAGCGMPKNVASNDSSDYNFASGRLDDDKYALRLKIKIAMNNRRVMFPIWREWLAEAETIPGFLPSSIYSGDAKIGFGWAGRSFSVNPLQESSATEIDLATGRTNLMLDYEDSGLDLEEEQERAAQSYGISLEEYRRILLDRTFKVSTQPQTQQQQSEGQ